MYNVGQNIFTKNDGRNNTTSMNKKLCPDQQQMTRKRKHTHEIRHCSLNFDDPR
jgi:hypothetical protein